MASPQRFSIYFYITNTLQHIINLLKKATADIDDLRHKNQVSVRKIACISTDNMYVNGKPASTAKHSR
jgi:hypothetical protein